MHTTRRLVLALAAAAAATAGCGSHDPEVRDATDEEAHDATTTPAEPEPPELLSLVPRESFIVLRADVARIRTSPYWEVVMGWFQQMDQLLAEAGGGGGELRAAMEALQSTDLGIVAVFPGPGDQAEGPDDDGGGVLIVRGRYQEGQLDQIVRLVARDDEGKAGFRVEQRGGHRVLVMEDMSAVALGTHTWVIGSHVGVDAVLARAEAGGGGGLSDALRAIAEEVRFEEAMASGVVEMTDELREELVQEFSEAADILSAGIRVEARDGVDVDATVVARTPEVVAAVVAEVQRFLQETSQQLGQGGGGFGDLGLRQVIDSAVVRGEGSRALLSVRVDDQTTRSMLDVVGGFLGILVALAGAADPLGPGLMPPPGGGLGPAPPMPTPGQP